MPDSNNNKALRNKQSNGGRTNTARNGNKRQMVDKKQEAADSPPHVKKPKTNQVNGSTTAVDNKAQQVKTAPKSRKAATAGSKRKGPVAKKAAVTNRAVSYVHPSQPGFVLAVGEGDTGQLGLGPDIMDRSKPARVHLPADVIQICAGGMHSVCLTVTGEVYTFGCNDEGALGREVDDEDECMTPGKVDLSVPALSVSAGDSHTAAITRDGKVFIWGTFRDASGPIGILPGQGKLLKPTQIMTEYCVVKVASGSDHLVCLTDEGSIYTLGSGEQGQLGRIAECFSARGGRRGLELLLHPSMVRCQSRHIKFCDIWTGQYCTFAKVKDTGDIYAWGLNNYYQLGFADMQNKFSPQHVPSFQGSKNWAMISIGQHHTVALDANGTVYSLGRKEYGRLGLGESGLEEKSKPTVVPKLQGKKCVHVSCGTAVSYAVTNDGAVYGWGMGSTKQLGQGDDEDDVFEPIAITGKQLQNKNCLMTSAGGQHTMLLARDRV